MGTKLETQVANVQPEEVPEPRNVFAEIGSKVAKTLEENASPGEDAQDEAAGHEGDSEAEKDAEEAAGDLENAQDSDTAEQATESERSVAELEELKSLKESFNYRGTLTEFVTALAKHHDASTQTVAQPAQQTQEAPIESSKDLKALLAEIEDEDPAVVAEKKTTLLCDEIVRLQQTTSSVVANAEVAKQTERAAIVERFEMNFDDVVGELGKTAASILGKGASGRLNKNSAEYKNREKLYRGVTTKAAAHASAHGSIPANSALKEIVTQEYRGLFFDQLQTATNKTLGEKLDKRAGQAQAKGDHEVGAVPEGEAKIIADIGAAREKWKNSK